jgi:hypothetical protein
MGWLGRILGQRHSIEPRTRGQASEKYAPLSEDAKTIVVASQSPESEPERESSAASRPSGRLSWPARDEAKSKRAESNKHAGRMLHEAETQRVNYEQAAKLLDAAANGDDAISQAETQLVGGIGPGREDPVAGWLVIIEGPGKGRSLEIGVGANQIGRAPTQKARIDFGDTSISREEHALLIYEPRTRRFIVQRGNGRNLTYVGQEPVVEPVDLKGGEEICVGATRLRFVPFCGPDFSWD